MQEIEPLAAELADLAYRIRDAAQECPEELRPGMNAAGAQVMGTALAIDERVDPELRGA
jgi:hypothetical protein